MKRLLVIIFLIYACLVSGAQSRQSWQVDWSTSSRLAGSTGTYMPFWARTGEDGILPLRSSGLLTAGADISYRSMSGFFFESGTNVAGALALISPLDDNPVYGFVDRLYISGGWKMLRMDVGACESICKGSDESAACPLAGVHIKTYDTHAVPYS